MWPESRLEKLAGAVRDLTELGSTEASMAADLVRIVADNHPLVGTDPALDAIGALEELCYAAAAAATRVANSCDVTASPLLELIAALDCAPVDAEHVIVAAQRSVEELSE